MTKRYQDIYPEPPLLDSAALARPSAAALLTLEYFEAAPGEMPEDIFTQHHLLLNLKEEPHRVENWRNGNHRDFTYHKDEIIITPAGIRSGWRWHEQSKVIVITLEPEQLETFAHREMGVLLTAQQLQDLPQFVDADLCQAGLMLRDALATRSAGSEVMFESLARVFLVKLIQKYQDADEEEIAFSARFTSSHYKRVLDHVAAHFSETITIEELARVAGLSTAHFSRLFKQTIGSSPHQFVMAYRAEQARKMLSNPVRPIIDVAISCGFADQPHLSRVFKQYYGETPGAYRKRLPGQG